MKEKISAELRGCKTLNQMWTVLNSYYDLDKEIGIVSKSIIVPKLTENIEYLAKLIGAKRK